MYITKNGKGGLAVMSIEHYEQMAERCKLYDEILPGLNDAASGKTRPFSGAMAELRSRRSS